MRHARSDAARSPFFAIAALCLALLGLALPRFGGSIAPDSGSANVVAAGTAARSADLAETPTVGDSDDDLAGDCAGYSAPVAGVVDVAAVLQRANEALQRLQIELGCSKARVLPVHARHDASRSLVAGDPVRVAEREVTAHASPLLRWRLAHSTSSAIG